MAKYLGERWDVTPHRQMWEFEPTEFEDVERFARFLAKAKMETPEFFIDGRKPVLRDAEGYMAEYAAACHYGAPMEWAVHFATGDSGYDLLVDGRFRLGVKGTSYKSKNTLLVKQRERKNAHGYVLVRVDKIAGICELIGWEKTSTIVEIPPRRFREGGPLNHEIPSHRLRPCSEPRVQEATSARVALREATAAIA